jgi:hypothetical protein
MAHQKYRSRILNVMCVGVLLILFVWISGGAVAAQEEVSNAQDLQDIRNDLDDDYVLVNDVDLANINNFRPIGTEEGPFDGSFDGDGYNITGLTIERRNDEGVGLFGDTGSNAVIQNVSLTGVSVDGRQWVGSLVGFNKGVVSNSHATGEVLADRRAGGLIGGNSGKIRRSYAQGNVTSVDIFGGLVGYNEGKINESYAEVSVAGFKGINALDSGGLVGINLGEIVESYATGEVLSDEAVGGLVGSSDGIVVESYATGEVIGDNHVGGLVGNMSILQREATLRDSYWDSQKTMLPNAVGAGAGSSVVEEVEGLQTDEMQGVSAESSMSTLDFTNTWETVTNPDSYPVLAWETVDREDGGEEDSDTDPPSDGGGLDIPDDFPDFQGSSDVFSAIDGDGDGISPSEMSIAVGEFLSDGTVGGKDVSPAEMSQVVGWFLAQ